MICTAIVHFRNHPEADSLRDYTDDPPDGAWSGRLDYLAWGKSSNLFCYFTDEKTGGRYRLAVFSSQGYKPYEHGPAFNEEEPGQCYEISTSTSHTGLTKFMAATRSAQNLAAEKPLQSPSSD